MKPTTNHYLLVGYSLKDLEGNLWVLNEDRIFRVTNKSPFRQEDTHSWKKQLERGLPLETRKQRGRRLAKERQLASGTTKSSRWRAKQVKIQAKKEIT